MYLNPDRLGMQSLAMDPSDTPMAPLLVPRSEHTPRIVRYLVSPHSCRFFACTLAAFAAYIHIIVVGSAALVPLGSGGIPSNVRVTLEAAWLFISIFLVISIFIFWRSSREIVRLVAALWLLSACAVVTVAMRNFGLKGLWFYPQWTVFCVVACLAVRGAD